MSYLFVYGTLMQNESNAYASKIRDNSIYIGKGAIYAKKYDLGDYPGIRLDNTKTHKTYGDLFQITKKESELLEFLDEYEGYISKNSNNNLFVRKTVDVHINSNRCIAWVYEYAIFKG